MRGIVMEIEKGQAVVMKRGGAFVQLPAKPHWQVGDVVVVKAQTLRLQVVLALAASLVILAALALGGNYYLVYNEPTALLSIDVNPSIELELNQAGKVVQAKAVNEDGEEILRSLQLKGLPYAEAVTALLQDVAFRQYLTQDPYMICTVQSNDPATAEALLRHLWDIVHAQVPGNGNNVEIVPVDSGTVQAAHSHGVSPGKYILLEELQQLAPDIDIEEYSHCSIRELHGHIAAHGGGHHGETSEPAPAESRSPAASRGGHEGQGSGHEGQGNGHGGTAPAAQPESVQPAAPQSESQAQHNPNEGHSGGDDHNGGHDTGHH